MINVDLLKSVKVTDEDKSLFVTFGYNTEILTKIKTIKPRHWLNDLKAWEFPQAGIHDLIRVFGKDQLKIDSDINTEYVKEVFEASENEDYSIFNPLLTKMPKDIADFTVLALKQVPSYFYHVGASSSGRFHPKYASGEGGLCRHTLAMGLIGLELYGNETMCGQFTNREKFLMLSAMILHDTFKHGFGEGGSTIAEHPLLASRFVKEMEQDILAQEELETIGDCIATHMGAWCMDYTQRNQILDKPTTEMQKFVHICDYLASRKLIEINFEVVK